MLQSIAASLGLDPAVVGSVTGNVVRNADRVLQQGRRHLTGQRSGQSSVSVSDSDSDPDEADTALGNAPRTRQRKQQQQQQSHNAGRLAVYASVATGVLNFLFPVTSALPVKRVISEYVAGGIRNEQHSWFDIRREYHDEVRKYWILASSRQFIDSKVEQLRILSEMTAFLGGFALACFVELPIPEGVPGHILAPFAAISIVTVCCFTFCSVTCTMLVFVICSSSAAITEAEAAVATDSRAQTEGKGMAGGEAPGPDCDMPDDSEPVRQHSVHHSARASSGELLYHERWTAPVQQDWKLALKALVVGVVGFMLLSAMIMFISAHKFPVRTRRIAGGLSLLILLYALLWHIVPVFKRYSDFLDREDASRFSKILVRGGRVRTGGGRTGSTVRRRRRPTGGGRTSGSDARREEPRGPVAASGAEAGAGTARQTESRADPAVAMAALGSSWHIEDPD